MYLIFFLFNCGLSPSLCGTEPAGACAVIPGFFRKRKSPCPIQFYCRDKSVHTINSCGATRLDVIYILSRIPTYAFFVNGVQSPAFLLGCSVIIPQPFSVRPQKPIHPMSDIPQSHRLRLSVKHSLRLLALLQRFKKTLSFLKRNVNICCALFRQRT